MRIRYFRGVVLLYLAGAIDMDKWAVLPRIVREYAR
jgi:hypothetical protein